MKRILSVIIGICLAACLAPLGAGAEEPVSWSLDGGTLAITGSGDMAFQKIPWADRLGEIQALRLDEGITAIQDGAFAGCANLTSVTLSKSLQYIGDEAFRDCGSLCWVTLPQQLIGIGEKAFSGCTKLTSIVVPGTVGRIGDRAFEPTIILRGHKNSASEDYIKDNGGTFRQVDYHKLASSSGQLDGMEWTLGDGAMTVTGKGTLDLGALEAYPWDALRGDIVTLELGEGITEVDAQAFALCRKLTKVTVPASLEKIAQGAFSEDVEIIAPAEETVETTEVTEAAQTTETTEVTEVAETTEATEAAEVTEAIEATEAAEAAEVTEATKATEATEATEVTEATEATEVTEVTEATETTEMTETTGPAEAAEEADLPAQLTLTVGQATAQPGQQVKLTISLSGNPGLCGLNFTIDYDHTRLTLEDYDCLDSQLTASDWSVGLGEGEKALWLQSDATEAEGEILTLVFRVSDAAPLGDTTVTLTDITGVDEEAKLLKPVCVSGGVTVSSGLLGDVNGDDRVTAADEKRLRRYLAGAKVAIETGNADMNGDGTVDLVDLMLLQKSLSK